MLLLFGLHIYYVLYTYCPKLNVLLKKKNPFNNEIYFHVTIEQHTVQRKFPIIDQLSQY